MSASPVTRRPIKARDSRWAANAAAALARRGVRPNTISIASVAFAAGAGLCLATAATHSPMKSALLFVFAGLGVQARLLCNLFDGMVAVEGGFKTKSGELFNELPDRFADAAILIGCGYGVGPLPCGIELGWTTALLAVIIAYVRALGAAIGAGQNFIGPMAKPQRMAAVTAGCALAAVLALVNAPNGAPGAWGVWIALLVIALGEIVTLWRRTARIFRTLESK